MKKKTFMLLIAGLFIMKATAQQVEQKQRTLITKVTATWCPPCGSWGWDLFENLIDDNNSKALLMTAHHSGALTNAVGQEVTSNFGVTSQPRFFVNNTDQNATSSNASSKRGDIMNMVDEAFAQMPVVNVGFAPTFGDNKLTVDAKVKFFQATEGEYYLSVYLMEDGVIQYQASIGDNANHKKVVRFNFSDNTFGELIVNGAVGADAEFDMPFELSIGEVAGYDYEVAGIIWKKDADKFIPVNVWSTKNIGVTSAVASVGALTSFDVQPTVTQHQATIQLELDQPIQQASLDIIDLQGKILTTVQQGTLNAGSHTFNINKELVGQAGLYFVRLTDGQQVSVQKVIFQ